VDVEISAAHFIARAKEMQGERVGGGTHRDVSPESRPEA
jgi:hypothetical protein